MICSCHFSLLLSEKFAVLAQPSEKKTRNRGKKKALLAAVWRFCEFVGFSSREEKERGERPPTGERTNATKWRSYGPFTLCLSLFVLLLSAFPFPCNSSFRCLILSFPRVLPISFLPFLWVCTLRSLELLVFPVPSVLSFLLAPG